VGIKCTSYLVVFIVSFTSDYIANLTHYSDFWRYVGRKGYIIRVYWKKCLETCSKHVFMLS
jgi:hypothetical protein